MIDIENHYEGRFVLRISGVVCDIEKRNIQIDNYGNIINIQMIFKRDLEKIQIGQEILLYIESNEFFVFSDTIKWNGFLDKNIRDFIVQFENVSGIGTTTAANIYECLSLKGMSMKEICDEISVGNIELFCNIPGMDEKRAQKLVNSLRDTITYSEFYESNRDIFEQDVQVNEAIKILFSLGYVKSDIDNVISKIKINDDITAMEIVERAIELLR